MFGSRRNYIEHFELTIPNQLYVDWHRCFVFHKLALEAIKAGLGSPVWLRDTRTSPVSAGSVDQANVSLDRGEMSFGLFSYDFSFDELISIPEAPVKKLLSLQHRTGEKSLPDYLIRYVEQTTTGSEQIAIHEPISIAGYKDADQDKIERQRGFIGSTQLQKREFPNAIHHFFILHNDGGGARLIYKFDGSIQFIKNLKRLKAREAA